MLAKLKYLKKEETALKDIETMVKEQVNRLQQEELYLKSLLRNTGTWKDKAKEVFPLPISHAKKDLFDNDETVNKVPLDDLQSTSHHQLHPNNVGDAEGEEDDVEDEDEEMDSEDGQGEEEINKDLMALMQQIQGEDSYEDDFEDDL